MELMGPVTSIVSETLLCRNMRHGSRPVNEVTPTCIIAVVPSFLATYFLLCYSFSSSSSGASLSSLNARSRSKTIQPPLLSTPTKVRSRAPSLVPTSCPHCHTAFTVPVPFDGSQQLDIGEIKRLLGGQEEDVVPPTEDDEEKEVLRTALRSMVGQFENVVSLDRSGCGPLNLTPPIRTVDYRSLSSLTRP